MCENRVYVLYVYTHIIKKEYFMTYLKISYRIDGKLYLIYENQDFYKQIFFDIPIDFFISLNALTALAIVCRPIEVKTIYFDFPVSEQTEAIINSGYNIQILSEIVSDTDIASHSMAYLGLPPSYIPKRNKTYLSFSGGLDSLAMRCMFPEIPLVSTDFTGGKGGVFQREVNFFERFHGHIVKTNLRYTGYQDIDWRFMGCGMILMSDYLGIKCMLVGSIMDASMWIFSRIQDKNFAKRTFNNRSYHGYEIAHIQEGKPILSATESGTARICTLKGEYICQLSLDSAADPDKLKYMSKSIALRLAFNKPVDGTYMKQNFGIIPNNRHHMGKITSFTDTLRSLYLLWKFGAEFYQQYIGDITPQAHTFIQSNSMAFYEKYNPLFTEYIPTYYRQRVLDTYKKVNIYPYETSDFENAQNIQQFLENCKV